MHKVLKGGGGGFRGGDKGNKGNLAQEKYKGSGVTNRFAIFLSPPQV